MLDFTDIDAFPGQQLNNYKQRHPNYSKVALVNATYWKCVERLKLGTFA